MLPKEIFSFVIATHRVIQILDHSCRKSIHEAFETE